MSKSLNISPKYYPCNERFQSLSDWADTQADSSIRWAHMPLCKTATLKKEQKLVFKTNYRLMQGEHSAMCLTFIKLQFVIKIFVLSTFEWPFYTGFTVPLLFQNTAELTELIWKLTNKIWLGKSCPTCLTF